LRKKWPKGQRTDPVTKRSVGILSDVVKGKVTEQVPLVLGRDFKVIDKDPNIRDRVKAAELLGKRYALFTDRVEATQEVTIEWVEDDDDT
jgi:phage terminase small subunit